MLFDSAIHSYISGYFKNEEKTLNISLWNGKVDIHNAELNLDLPFVNISKAFFKSVSLSVPWTTLLTDSVSVVGHGISIEISADEPASPSSATPPPSAKDSKQSKESNEVIQKVKLNTKLELFDVDIAIKYEDHVLRVRAKEMSTSPHFSNEEDESDDEEEEEKHNSRRLKFTELSVHLGTQEIISPLSLEVIASFSLHPRFSLRYCSVCVLSLARVSVSDVQINLLKTVVTSIIANRNSPLSSVNVEDVKVDIVQRRSDEEKAEEQEKREREREKEREREREKEREMEAKTWTSSIWNYGSSWFKSGYYDSPKTLSPAKKKDEKKEKLASPSW